MTENWTTRYKAKLALVKAKYSTGFFGFLDLLDKVDNGTTHITIETPDGWKCERKGCVFDFTHTHGTYSTLQ